MATTFGRGQGGDDQRWIDGELEAGADDENASPAGAPPAAGHPATGGPARADDDVVGAEDLQGEETTFEPEEPSPGG
jgi:hypothetical protein